MTSPRFQNRHCLDCGALLDCQKGLASEVPGDGDVSVCLYCGGLAFYASNGQQLRRPTSAEEMMLAADENIQRATFAAKLIRSRLGRPGLGWRAHG